MSIINVFYLKVQRNHIQIINIIYIRENKMDEMIKEKLTSMRI